MTKDMVHRQPSGKPHAARSTIVWQLGKFMALMVLCCAGAVTWLWGPRQALFFVLGAMSIAALDMYLAWSYFSYCGARYGKHIVRLLRRAVYARVAGAFVLCVVAIKIFAANGETLAFLLSGYTLVHIIAALFLASQPKSM